MDLKEFRKHAEKMVDYVIDYLENNSEKRITPSVRPGYLKPLLPSRAPTSGESFEKIMEDFEKYILPGLMRPEHPGFYAFIPSVPCYPSILTTFLRDIINCIGLNWKTWCLESEFEAIVLDRFGKMIGLPDAFLSSGNNKGGGVIRSTSTECFVLSMLTARQNMLKLMLEKRPHMSQMASQSSFIAYFAKDCDIGVKKAVNLCLINARLLETDKLSRLRGETLSEAIIEDKRIGLIPFFVNATLGTVAGVCDALDEIGPVCQQHGLWLNVDSSYAGNALVCPEMRHYLTGVEHASSFVVNPSRWLMVHRHCVAMFTKDLPGINDYVMTKRTEFAIDCPKAWSSYQEDRSYFAFKLWTVIRSYGTEGLQEYIRNHIRLAKLLAANVERDERFEVLTTNFGIVCFRLIGTDEINKELIRLVNCSGKLFLNSFSFKDKFAVRFILCSENANSEDIMNAWSVISQFADEIFEKAVKAAISDELSEFKTIFPKIV